MPQADDDEVLTVQDAANDLAISTRTLARQTDLPRIRLSARRVGYLRRDLREWKQSRRVIVAAPAAQAATP